MDKFQHGDYALEEALSEIARLKISGRSKPIINDYYEEEKSRERG